MDPHLKLCLYREWWRKRNEFCVSREHAGKTHSQRFREMWGETLEEAHKAYEETAIRESGGGLVR